MIIYATKEAVFGSNHTPETLLGTRFITVERGSIFCSEKDEVEV